MKIQIKKFYAGPLGCHAIGAILDLPDDEAAVWLAKGDAVRVGGDVERAVEEKPREVKPKPRRRAKRKKR
jgi:hypothetical protein